MWIVIVLIFVSLSICFACEMSNKKKINEIEKHINEINIQIKDKQANTDQKIEMLDSQALLLKSLIQENDRNIQTVTTDMSSTISQLQKTVDKLSQSLTDLEARIDFYLNIDEESLSLNGNDYHNDFEKKKKDKDQDLRISNQDSNLDLTSEEESAELKLDTEQEKAMRYMNTFSENVFVTGKAGTGKSFLLNSFRQKNTHKNILVLAPTGIAAINVNGATLHSVFGYDNLVNLNLNEINNDSVKLKHETRMILKNVSTIIIDEISMVRVDIFEKIDKILKLINQTDRPFGGKQMIVFGDLFQLPPIAKLEEKKYLLDTYGGIFFFFSSAYINGNFYFVELTNNHRQKGDKAFFDILSRIREGRATDEDIEKINRRVVADNSIYDRHTALLPKKDEVDEINKKRIAGLSGIEFVHCAKIKMNKKNDQNPSLINLPIVETLRLKIGALVMMVNNDPEKRWVNGTLGIVKDFDENRLTVSIRGRAWDIAIDDFSEQEVAYVDGHLVVKDVLKVEQYPVVPAYAMTIHKAQGQTYQKIICDIDRCFSNGQAYVALSRCTSLDGLHLIHPISKTSIKVDKDILQFYLSQREKMSQDTV